MISVTVVFTPTHAQSQTAPAAPATPLPPDPAQLRQQIRASIEAARQAARDAGQAQRDAGQAQRVIVGPNGISVGPVVPGQPGTIYVNPRAMDNMIPQQAVTIALGFFAMIAVMVVGWPIARAFGRRIERRGQVAALDAGTMEQLQRIEQAVDAMAIEVERISESQRFMARLQRDTSAQALPSVESR